MLELPASFRTLLVERLDEYCENLDNTFDAAGIAESFIETIESVAQEVTQIDAEAILSQLESAIEDGTNLVESLEEHLKQTGTEGANGERMLGILETVCELEWLEDDVETGGFFSDDAVLDDDF